MSTTDLEKIREIAKASLMPDFFAVRVDEEGLWSGLKELLSRLQPSAPNSTIDKVRRIAKDAATANDFIDKIKAVSLWPSLRELIPRIQTK